MRWKDIVLSCLLVMASVRGGSLIARAVNISTSVITVPAVTTLTQNDFRWYGNVNALTPTSALASQNGTMGTPSLGTQVRLRMNVGDTVLALPSGARFKLQYANATSGAWTDLSTSTAWIFFDNPAVADGQIIVTTVLASSTVGESYGESNPSATSPSQLLPGDYGEWDWVLLNNSAATGANWFFRMVYASGTALDGYRNYPALSAVTPAPPSGSSGSGSGGSSPPVVSAGGGGTGLYAAAATSSGPTSSLPVSPPLVPPPLQCIDFDGDNRVDIVDLSILLYYYGEPAPAGTCYDLDHDGIVDFPDISILMYYWTG